MIILSPCTGSSVIVTSSCSSVGLRVWDNLVRVWDKPGILQAANAKARQENRGCADEPSSVSKPC